MTSIANLVEDPVEVTPVEMPLVANPVEMTLDEIINDTFANGVKPNIVNEASNFVVITYWWGRGKLNSNISRPCVSFYEDYIKQITKQILTAINSIISSHVQANTLTPESPNIIFDKIKDDPSNLLILKIIQKMAEHYINDICDHEGIEKKLPKKGAEDDEKKAILIENLNKIYEKNDKYKQNFDSLDDLVKKLAIIFLPGIIENKQNFITLSIFINQTIQIKHDFIKIKKEKVQSLSKNNKLIKLLTDKLELYNSDPELLRCIKAKEPLAEIKLRKQIKELKKITELVKIETQIKEFKKNVVENTQNKNNVNQAILAIFKKKDEVTKKSIYDKLIDLLQYKPPIMYEDMITEWENSCKEKNCNHMAVEFPAFAKDTKGYQNAINAKPRFIKKALEVCEGRSVLYIDGDMYIRQYPAIFDMKNVDFMARGWNIDPRSSYQMLDSISYDPYSFETSGGIMFFLNSYEAIKLLYLWISTMELPVMKGKADDRVLSLIFNTQSVLLWIRIIQLPIEYLWLTLGYDERLNSELYYNDDLMRKTIIVEHPECLTSEDTASGAGSSSNRQPKYYEFIENITPCVETTHEYIMFKDLVNAFPESAKEVVDFMNTDPVTLQKYNEDIAPSLNTLKKELNDPILNDAEKILLKKDISDIKFIDISTRFLPYLFWYYYYMSDTTYLDNGEIELVDLGLVDPTNPENNVQPLNIISYRDKYGNKQHHGGGKGETMNVIVKMNIDNATSMNLTDLESNGTLTVKTISGIEVTEINPVAINSGNYTESRDLIKIIIRLLQDKKTIIYNPTAAADYNARIYKKLIENLDTKYKNIHFGFNPIHIIYLNLSGYFTPNIAFNQPMLFRPDDRLIDFLSMQLSLEDFSSFIKNGSYEFISLVKVAFLFPEIQCELASALTGGANDDAVVDAVVDANDDAVVDANDDASYCNEDLKLTKRRIAYETTLDYIPVELVESTKEIPSGGTINKINKINKKKIKRTRRNKINQINQINQINKRKITKTRRNKIDISQLSL